MPSSPAVRSRIHGCLLGGAVGDALGAPVEFLSWERIRETFGPGGIADYVPTYGRSGAFTDDTQMTLFTAEGLIRAWNRWSRKGICFGPGVVWRAYRRWRSTQGAGAPELPGSEEPSGWLVGVRGLHARRAPGNTCLDALDSGRMGRPGEPLNDSKGCGGVMRIAPVGLACRAGSFEAGCELAAITHGHASGYLSAGFLARMIDAIVAGCDLDAAADAAEQDLVRWPGHAETLEAVRAARRLARAGEVTPRGLESLGGGWTGEEALAVALAAAMAGGSFAEAVRLAVNHSGDSDSTGSIAGQLRGALEGVDAIPPRWLEGLELREVVEMVAEDLYRAGHVPEALDAQGCYDLERYPAG